MSEALRASNYDAYDRTSVTVSTDAELSAALADLTSNGGGKIILAQDGGPFNIQAKGIGNADSPVLITSQNPSEPAVIQQVDFNKASHITISNVMFRTDAPNRQTDISVFQSDHIEIVDSTMRGHANGFLSEDGDATRGDSLMSVRESTDVKILNNDIADYFHGIGALDNTRLVVAGNEIRGIQGDGFRGGGLNDAIISQNHMHSFYGTTQTINHSDMIQLWGTSTKSANRNIQISGNFLDADGGAATQSIFILNEWIGREGPAGAYFENITITDNVVHNGAWHGIAASNTKNLVLRNNTVLWDEDAKTKTTATSDAKSAPPHIYVADAPNAQVEDNIAYKFSIVEPTLDLQALTKKNTVITYDDQLADNYVEKVIVNYDAVGDHDLRDFMVRADSGLGDDVGADIDVLTEGQTGILPVAAINAHPYDDNVLSFSARDTLLLDENTPQSGYDVRWVFEDGTVLRGLDVHRRFDTPGSQVVTLQIYNAEGLQASLQRGFEIEDPLLFKTGFEDTGKDLSSYDSAVALVGAPEAALVAGRTGKGFFLTDGHGFQILDENEQIQSLNRFHLEFDVRMASQTETGRMMFQSQILELKTLPDGTLEFRLTTDKGTFSVRSDAGEMKTLDWQTVAIHYDGPANSLTLSIDGSVVGETLAMGTTKQTDHPLVFGAPWAKAAKATFDNVSFSKPASKAFDTELTKPEPLIRPNPDDQDRFDVDFSDQPDDSNPGDGGGTPPDGGGNPDDPVTEEVSSEYNKVDVWVDDPGSDSFWF